MRASPTVFVVLGFLLFSISPSSVSAQGCIESVTSNYSAYQDVSSDGNTIYTSVAVEGGTNMVIDYSQSWCGGILGGQTHQSWVYNHIGSTGGWVWGGTACVDCYLSAENDQSIVAEDGVDYTFNWGAEVDCSVSGQLFSILDFLDVELAYTKSKYNGSFSTAPDGGAVCYVGQWCSVASQPALCDPSYVIQEPFIVGQQASCSQYYNTIWLAEKFSWQTDWGCFPLLPGQNAIGTSDSSVATCTKHP